jgi:Skp family chaperone for outer membrane proteins
MSSSSKKIVRELQDIQKKIEAKEHYYTEDELDAIW